MIVKNENHVITRCLDSVRRLLDTWVIVDTGSTDGTQQTILDTMRDIPGELFERPWIDFGHNRSESLALARNRADYVLIIDADEVLESDPGFSLPVLDADSYYFSIHSGGLAYYKTQLVRDALEWRFNGVVHEYIHSARAIDHRVMDGLHTLRIPDGARSRDPLTFRKDALLLEEALLKEPDSTRHMFYLAQSYADAHEPLLAIDRYGRRAAMGGWAEEAWYSLYRIAILKRELNVPWPEVMGDYLAAYSFYPVRMEPLFQVGYYYQTQKQYPLAYMFFAQAMQVPYPKTDLLFVEQQVYDVLLPIEYSVASYYIGRHYEAIHTANRMLAKLDLNSELVDKLILNRSFSLEALFPKRVTDLVKSSKFIVCIVLGTNESLSPACCESLRSQTHPDFHVVIVETGTSSAIHKFTADYLNFEWKQLASPENWGDCLQLAAEHALTDDIILVMSGDDLLSDVESLTRMAAHFESYDCAVMYGQFRWSDGTRGNAMPLASAEEMETHRWDERPLVPLAFRCGVLRERKVETRLELLRYAGFERIRFNDEVTLVRSALNLL